MQQPTQLPYPTLLLMISFASVNAVLFTPALPEIADYFRITEGTAQLTITWFLIGYTFGQLFYGPIANRFGRKPALFAGIYLQILSCLLCVLAVALYNFQLLVVARCLLALGSGVGLKMSYTMINETYSPQTASKKISYLMLSFAITPSLAVVVGGYLCSYYSWVSTFYASAVYGIILFIFALWLPETKPQRDHDALKLSHIIEGYSAQFRNVKLMAGGLLMGGATSFVYIFAALAPFIAIDVKGMEPVSYGNANLLPSAGLILGSIASARLLNYFEQRFIIRLGIFIAIVGSLVMLLGGYLDLPVITSLFVPMTICYFGLSMVVANASTLAMFHVSDKSHASAVMNFINMGFATMAVLIVGHLDITNTLMPAVFTGIALFMAALFYSAMDRTATP